MQKDVCVSNNNCIKFVDLFCGIGGFRIGLTRMGYECVFSCDIDKGCRDVYNWNFFEIPESDIKDVSAKDVPDHDLLCAGFPCQPFSISGKKKGFLDVRGSLFFEICRIIMEKNPKVVFLENVKHLIHHDSGNTLNAIIYELEGMGYNVSWKVLNATEFGLPQNRERVIIIASKGKAFDFEKVKLFNRTTLEEFLDKADNFEYLSPENYTLIENPKKQPSGLIFAGYRNKSIRKKGVRQGTEYLSRVHKQPNRIYSSNGVHPTLPSQESSGRFYILISDGRVRKLTINECYRIMGFPEDFIKANTVVEQYKQIGNSVCIPMIESISESIFDQFFI